MSENATPIAPKVSMQTKLSYGYGSFGKDLSLCLVNTFLFFYLTDVAEVSAAACGIIFLAARIWDTINDPIFGFIVAKCNSRWGKYKPWIFVGNVLNAIFMTACFSTHYFEGTTQLIYLTVVYICWGMSYTVCDAPFWSLIPNITLDKTEREGLLPYPRFAATIGGYIAAGCGIYCVHLFGQGDDGLGYMLYAALGGFFALSSAIVTCKWTEETYKAPADETFSLKEAVFITTHNKQFLIFLSLAFCYVIGTGIYGSLNLYFFKYCLKDESLFANLMLFASIAAVPSLIFFKPVVARAGRKTLFLLAISAPFAAATLVSLPILGITFIPTNILVAISGLCTGFSNAIYWLFAMIMVADTVDYGDMEYNVRSESIYYSLHTLLSKCTGAVSSAIIGLFLALINYVPNVEQTQGTIEGLTFLYWGSSALCILGACIYIFFYKLNGEKLDEVQRVLTRRYMDRLVKKSVSEGDVKDDLELLKQHRENQAGNTAAHED